MTEHVLFTAHMSAIQYLINTTTFMINMAIMKSQQTNMNTEMAHQFVEALNTGKAKCTISTHLNGFQWTFQKKEPLNISHQEVVQIQLIVLFLMMVALCAGGPTYMAKLEMEPQVSSLVHPLTTTTTTSTIQFTLVSPQVELLLQSITAIHTLVPFQITAS